MASIPLSHLSSLGCWALTPRLPWSLLLLVMVGFPVVLVGRPLLELAAVVAKP